jgi:hypothetical protein
MKRDALWLQARNEEFKKVEGEFDVVYFREVGGEGLMEVEQVSCFLSLETVGYGNADGCGIGRE